MSDLPPAPAPVTAQTPEALDYKPMSLLAVLGFGLAVVTAAVIVGLLVFALISGMPLLIQLILLPAAVALALSLAGWWSIRNSEGTRAGLGLAKWGTWISLIFGLSYLFYIGTKEIAVRWEAQSETDLWFQSFQEGKFNEAFIMTLDPETRRGDNPQNPRALESRYTFNNEGQKARLATFQENELIKVLRRAGKDIKVEHVGVRNWEYLGGANKGYRVEQIYRITTPEAVMEVQVTTLGTESQGGHFKGRKWQVVMDRTGIMGDRGTDQYKQTGFGQTTTVMRNSAGKFFAEWRKKLGQGQLAEAYLDTCEPERRDGIRAEYAARLAGLALAQGSTPFGPLAVVSHPCLRVEEDGRVAFFDASRDVNSTDKRSGYYKFLVGEPVDKGGIYDESELQTVDDPSRTLVILVFKNLMIQYMRDPFAVPPLQDTQLSPFSSWQLDDGAMRFFQPFEMPLSLTPYRCEGMVEVVTTDPFVLETLQKVKQSEGTGLPEGIGDRTINWHIRRLQPRYGLKVQQQSGPPGM